MSEFDQIKLRRLDLTLLLVFLGLMRHRKAADVAAELGLTPSTVSHALSRLRDAFGDPLFLRCPHGMEPTAFAEGIAPGIRAAVEALDGALSETTRFDPAETTATLRLSALDYELTVLFPDFLNRLRRRAPGLRVAVRTLSREDAYQALSENRIDLALGYFWDRPERLRQADLLREDYLVAARRDHPLMTQRMTLEKYAAAEHAIVAPDGEMSGIADKALAEHGLERRVVTAVPEFLPALALLQRTDLVGTLPARLVRRHASAFGLEYRVPPLELRSFTSSAIWHERNDRAGLVAWARSELIASLAT